jgi:PAS domain S-box-containing protein
MQYELLKTVTSASNALQTAADLRPDILMIGVHLEGQSDGVETAIQINQKLNLPLLFLIRPNDKQYLERIKQTRHDGYLFLPPSESELHFSIELALAHHQMNEMVKEKWTLLSTTLKSIGDAVITTDPHGLITFLNPVAEKLTGWSLQEASGKRLPLVFNIINERTGLKARNPLTRILTKGIITALANHTMLISKNGQRIPIDDSGAPIKDSNGKILGAVLVFRDITERRKAEEALEQERNLLRTVIDNIPDKIYVKDVAILSPAINPSPSAWVRPTRTKSPENRISIYYLTI